MVPLYGVPRIAKSMGTESICKEITRDRREENRKLQFTGD